MSDIEDKKVDKKAGAGRGKKNLPKPDEATAAAATTMEAPAVADPGRTRPVRKATQAKEVVEQVRSLFFWTLIPRTNLEPRGVPEVLDVFSFLKGTRY